MQGIQQLISDGLPHPLQQAIGPLTDADPIGRQPLNQRVKGGWPDACKGGLSRIGDLLARIPQRPQEGRHIQQVGHITQLNGGLQPQRAISAVQVGRQCCGSPHKAYIAVIGRLFLNRRKGLHGRRPIATAIGIQARIVELFAAPGRGLRGADERIESIQVTVAGRQQPEFLHALTSHGPILHLDLIAQARVER